jgi:S-adenosylmethionine decarboxylase proenzyme
MEHSYTAPEVGSEISCIMHGIDKAVLADNTQLEKTLLEALKEDNFSVLDSVSHTFSPHGFTLIVLLAESHAAIHSYPEYNSLYFHLYSCRGPKDGEKALQCLHKTLKPTSVDTQRNEARITYQKSSVI